MKEIIKTLAPRKVVAHYPKEFDLPPTKNKVALVIVFQRELPKTCSLGLRTF